MARAELVPQLNLGDKVSIAWTRLVSTATRADVIVNEPSPTFPQAEVEEIHPRKGKYISIGFDGDGFPVGRKEVPTKRIP